MTKQQQRLKLEQLDKARSVAHGAWLDYVDCIHAAEGEWNKERGDTFMEAWSQFCRVYGQEYDASRLWECVQGRADHWVLYICNPQTSKWDRFTPMIGGRPQPFYSERLLHLWFRESEHRDAQVVYREEPLCLPSK